MRTQKNRIEANTISTSAQEMIPLSVPEIQGNEWKYIKECLDTGWVSSVGAFVGKFEQSLAEYVGRKYAVACVNGTAALHLAVVIAGIQPDEEVLVPALTFIAPANAVRYVGAWPVFIDVQKDIWQMDPQKVKDFLTKECRYVNGRLINRHTKRAVRAIIPVHILGHPVDMDPIIELAKKFNLIIIEDVAESIGARYKGRKTGQLGHLACFSFNGNKVITSGGGGMLVTDNARWAERAHYLSTQAKDDDLYYIHNEIGFNYRLSNIQAALGVAQMENLDKYIASKRLIAYRYDKELGLLSGLSLPREAKWAESIFWLYTVLLDSKKLGLSQQALIDKFRDSGIQVRPLWYPLHRLKPFQECWAYKIEQADKIHKKALSLPSSIGLTQQRQDRVIEFVKELFATGKN